MLGKYCPCVRCLSEADPGISKQPGKPGSLPGSDADRRKQSVESAVASALREADREDVILAFGSLSYLHWVKDAYDKAVW